MAYRDCVKAIDWLEKAFGFERHAVYTDADGKTVVHAEMSFGNGMIMLGSVSKQSPYTKYRAHPDEIGGRETRSVSLIVSDAEAIYRTAKAAGAEMVFDIQEKLYGGKGFSCRDPEGYMWHIDEYDPWHVK
jgi:uncharacterized glyoxalase superfamily protein PhnB